MNGSAGGWENTRANLQPNEIPTCRGPCPCSSPLWSGVRAALARRGSTFGTRVDSAGWCAGVRRGGRATCVSRRTAASLVAIGVTLRGSVQMLRFVQLEAADKGFRRSVSVPAPLQAEQRFPRRRGSRAAVAAGRRACPSPSAGLHAALRLSRPRRDAATGGRALH